MRKANLRDGTPCLFYNTEIIVREGLFIKSLTNRFYSMREDFPTNLTKKEAKEILKSEIRHYGHQGAFEDGYFEASSEEGEIYEAIYQEAQEWVRKNYPDLQDK